MNNFTRAEPQRQAAFPVAKAGYGFIFAAAFATLVFALLELTILAVSGLLITLFIGFFFRDPDRVIPGDANLVVSPADGRVILAEPAKKSPFSDEPQFKISIFMSVFNVHVNRIPHEGKIKRIRYNPGKFFSANLDKASMDNEQNALLLETENGKFVCFVQIAGLIARRIICGLAENDVVSRGHRFGMICFGSRLDVYLPPDSLIRVGVGDKVRSGTSVLGVLT